MRLQSRFIAKVLALNECLDPGVFLPVLASDFIAADVEMLVRKQRGHLGYQFVDKRIDSIIGWIERRVINAERVNDVVGTG